MLERHRDDDLNEACDESMGTNQQEGHSKAKVTAFANSPLTWKALPICLNVSPSCNCNRGWATANGCAFR